MTSLFSITQEYLQALEGLQVNEETGEVTGFDEWEKLGGDFRDKAEAVCLYIKNTEALATAIKAEEGELAKRRKIAENKVERLKEYLDNCLKAAGYDQFETPKAKVTYRKSTEVYIINEKDIPTDFMVMNFSFKPDKKAIKEALKEGEVSGAELRTKTNMYIK